MFVFEAGDYESSCYNGHVCTETVTFVPDEAFPESMFQGVSRRPDGGRLEVTVTLSGTAIRGALVEFDDEPIDDEPYANASWAEFDPTGGCYAAGNTHLRVVGDALVGKRVVTGAKSKAAGRWVLAPLVEA